jgi:hypothetical protein
VGLEPFAWWYLNYVIIPFAAGSIVVFLVHELLRLYWDLLEQRLARRRRRMAYERLRRRLQGRLRQPREPPEPPE